MKQQLESALGKLGRQLNAPIRLPGLKPRSTTTEAGSGAPPGAMPGIESMANVDVPPPAGTVRVRCADYGPDRVELHEVTDLAVWISTPDEATVSSTTAPAA